MALSLKQVKAGPVAKRAVVAKAQARGPVAVKAAAQPKASLPRPLVLLSLSRARPRTARCLLAPGTFALDRMCRSPAPRVVGFGRSAEAWACERVRGRERQCQFFLQPSQSAKKLTRADPFLSSFPLEPHRWLWPPASARPWPLPSPRPPRPRRRRSWSPRRVFLQRVVAVPLSLSRPHPLPHPLAANAEALARDRARPVGQCRARRLAADRRASIGPGERRSGLARGERREGERGKREHRCCRRRRRPGGALFLPSLSSCCSPALLESFPPQRLTINP